jgi:hypothetical protein
MDNEDSRAGDVIRVHDQMVSERGNFNTNWQTVADFVLPNYSDFTSKKSDGQRRTNRIFDDTAPLALKHGAAAMESMICPASTRWHALEALDPSLQADITVKQYMDAVTDVLFRLRYAPKANFQSQMQELFFQALAFGNAPFLVDDVYGYGLRYRALHLANTYGVENAAGVFDWIHQEYELSAAACIDALKRGMFDYLPAAITDAANIAPQRKFKFIHSVKPNEDRNPRAKDYMGKAFYSCIVCVQHKCVVKESGYDTQPITIARYQKSPMEQYGRSPCMDILPTILSLNEMEKSDLRMSQRRGDPPLLLADDGMLGPPDMRSNAFNYGGLSADGKPLIVPFQVGGDKEASQEKLNEKRKIVNQALLVDIFSILTQQPQMTATEVLQRAQEKGYLLAPIIGRFQSECIGPMIEREIDIANRAGQLPPMPDKLKKAGGIEFKITYQSQIQIAQKQGRALSISQSLQQMAPLIQADPNVMKEFNTTRMAREIFDSNGAPASCLNTPEELAQNDAQAAQQQNMANLAQIAGPASAAIKNLAQAQQASGSAAPGNLMGAQQ